MATDECMTVTAPSSDVRRHHRVRRGRHTAMPKALGIYAFFLASQLSMPYADAEGMKLGPAERRCRR